MNSNAGNIGGRPRRSLVHLTGQLQTLIRTRLWAQILVGMVLGVGLGVALGPSTGWVSQSTANAIGNWVALPGHIFLKLVQMIVMALIISSIIRGIASSEDLEQLRRVGLRVVFYFIGTTVVAIVIGIALAYAIQPGKYVSMEMLSVTEAAPAETSKAAAERLDIATIPDKLVTILPHNLIGSMANGQMLQLVVFSLIVGIALVTMPRERARPLLDMLASVQEVCMTIVRWAMLLAPFAVFGLMAQITSKVGLQALFGMAVYVGVVLLGLGILLALYLCVVWGAARMRPLPFLGAIRETLLLAFSTSSSAAVMPLSMKTVEEKLGVRPAISQFVIPIGATINMNGTALYQGVATVFLAQVFHVDLSLGALVLVIITAVGASVGSPAAPGVGIVILSMVLESVGIPVAGIAIILGVDRILDMSRTALNVAGDLTACVLMDRWVGGGKTSPDSATGSNSG